jgi:AraC-like DNA-binding protein/mannose-6-phosphate isomerase-like protein (cupin superfamily)
MSSTRGTRQPLGDRAELTAFRLATGAPIEVMRAWYRTQSFARHSHEYFTVGLVLSGTGSLWWRGGVQTLRPDEVVVIPPGEVHTGGLGEGDAELSYLAAHIPDEAVALCAATRGAAASLMPNGGPCVIRDARMSAQLRRLARATERQADVDAGEADESVTMTIELLVDQLSARTVPDTAQAPRAAAPFVRRARQIIDDCYADNSLTSLAALARAAGVTPFHLVREFTRATGLSPHRYLVQTRIREARVLLARGMPPSSVAAVTGFVDQSHLTTHFKRYVGTTPASYRRGVGGRI